MDDLLDEIFIKTIGFIIIVGGIALVVAWFVNLFQ